MKESVNQLNHSKQVSFARSP